MSLRVGHHVRDARVANLPLRPHQPLRHRRRRDEERARDLVGVEPAERAERQRDLRVERQRRVAAGEDQAKAIVRDLAGVVVGLLDGPVEPRRARARRAPPPIAPGAGCGRWPCAAPSG